MKKFGQILLMAVLLLVSLTACFADTAKNTPNLVSNPSFEKGYSGKNYTVPNWTVVSDNDPDASFSESGWTHSGQNKITHWKDKDFKVSTYQTVENIPQGVYFFRFWYANGEGGNDCYVELKDFGGDPIKMATPRQGAWGKLEAKNIKITTGKCTMRVYSDAKAGYWINLDDFLLCDMKDMPVDEAVAQKVKKNFLVNGNFDTGKTLTGWEVVSEKDKNAAYLESSWFQDGKYKLTNYNKTKDYKVYTYQTVNDLKNDAYALEFWYTNGGKQNECYVEIKDFGGKTIRETLPTNESWGKVRIPNINVTAGKCTVGIYTDAKAEYWIDLDSFSLTPDEKYAAKPVIDYPAKEYPLQMKGIDLSTLAQVEAGGGKFYNFDGQQEDVFKILKDNGVNYVRLRIWNNPKKGICGEASVLAMAKRIKKAGMGFFLDFHFSDTWADPSKQVKPAAWKNLDFAGLNNAVYEYTNKVIKDCKVQGTLPDMVQIGNEIRTGMLFPDGQLTTATSFKKLAQLVGSGIKGVKDASGPNGSVKIAIHLDKGTDNAAYTYFFDNLISYGVDFDIIGLSYYPFWHGKAEDLYQNMSQLAAKYHKDMVIAEMSYPYTLTNGDGLDNMLIDDGQLRDWGYPATIAGQKEYIEDLMKLVKHTPDGRGLGLFYWEGAWLPVKGAGWDPDNPESKNAWENQCLFNFEGYALDSLKAFKMK